MPCMWLTWVQSLPLYVVPLSYTRVVSQEQTLSTTGCGFSPFYHHQKKIRKGKKVSEHNFRAILPKLKWDHSSKYLPWLCRPWQPVLWLLLRTPTLYLAVLIEPFNCKKQTQKLTCAKCASSPANVALFLAFISSLYLDLLGPGGLKGLENLKNLFCMLDSYHLIVP